MNKDIEALRKRFSQGKPVIGGGTKHDRLIIKKGESPKIRIMPGEYGPNSMFFVEQSQHWIPGKDGKDFPYACLATPPEGQEPEDCRVCYWWQKFSRINKELIEGPKEEVDKKIKIITGTHRKLNLRRSFVMNVVLRGKTQDADKHMLYAAPQTVFTQIYELIEKNLEEGVYLLDEDSGFDITITREDKDNQTSYTVAAVLKSRPIGDENGMIGTRSWEDCRVNLDEVIREDIEKTRKYRSNLIKAVDELCTPVWAKFNQYAVDLDEYDDNGDQRGSLAAVDADDGEDDIRMDFSNKDKDKSTTAQDSRSLLEEDDAPVPDFKGNSEDTQDQPLMVDDEDFAEIQRKAMAFLED